MDYVAFASRMRRRTSGGSVDPDAGIAAILAGDSNVVFDMKYLPNMWQEDTKTTQVSAAGQTIGAIDTKYGTAARTFQQGTVAGRPLWDASGFAFCDGTNDGWAANANALSIANAVNGLSGTMIIFPTNTSVTRGLIGIGTATTNSARFVLQTLSTGAIELQLRRVDGATLYTITSAAGVIIPNNYYTITARVNYLTGACSIRVNGVEVISGTLPGTDGVNGTSATNSNRCRLFLNVANTPNYFAGYVGNVILARQYLSDTDAATCEAWCANLISEGGAEVLGQAGATWFNSPDMLADGDMIYVGTAQDDGRTSRFLAWNTVSRTAIIAFNSATAAGDDHDNMAIIKLADGSFLSASVGHNVAEVYIGKGATPFALVETGIDVQLGTGNYSYANLIQLDGETDDPIYLFGRAGSPWSARYSSSSDGGITWGAYTIWAENGTDRPYVQYWKSSPTRIDFVLTEGHPDTSATSIWHGYFEGGTFYKTDGTALGPLPIAPSDFTLVFDGTSTGGAWCWDLKRVGGVLACTFASFPSTTNHRYHIATLSGTTWTTETVVPDAGTYLYAAQPYYSGGICLHPTNLNITYCSVVSGGVHQVFPYTKSGTWSAGTVITSGAVPSFRPNTMGNALTFIRGVYTTYTDFPGCRIMGMLI